MKHINGESMKCICSIIIQIYTRVYELPRIYLFIQGSSYIQGSMNSLVYISVYTREFIHTREYELPSIYLFIQGSSYTQGSMGEIYC